MGFLHPPREYCPCRTCCHASPCYCCWLPPQPVPLKITVSDITSQKLVRSAAERPRGLLCHLDEMNSWIRKLTDKQSGEDRSTWVVSYESESYDMDRVGSGSIHADNLAVSVFGNIQPRVYRDNMNALTSDGLLQRFIAAILRGEQTRLGNPVPAFMSNEYAYEQMLRLIFALPAQTYRLDADAVAQQLPGDDVGMVLQHRKQNPVSRLQLRAAP